MSKDIRSFFNLTSKKSSVNEKSTTSGSKLSESHKKSSSEVKRKRKIIESEDEDTVEEKIVSSKKDKSIKKSKQSPKKSVEVDLVDMFGSEPVKRRARPKNEKKLDDSKSLVELIIDSDSDKDLSMVLDNVEKSQKNEKITTPIKHNLPREEKKNSSTQKSERVRSSSRTPKKDSSTPAKIKPSSAEKSKNKVKRDRTRSPQPPPALKKSTNDEPLKKSSKKEKTDNKEYSAEADEARHERKLASIALFHKMKTRPSVLNHGCKEIPEGKPDCLKGCQFLISGVLESMEREEAATLIKSCGGVVSNGLSKKITHFLVGEDAGPAKLAKAETMGIKQISEDDLLDMIREKSGLKSKAKIETSKEEDKVNKKSEKSETKESPGKENKQENELKNMTKSPPKTSKHHAVPVSSSTSSTTMSLSAAPTSDEIVLSLVDKYKPTNVKQIVGQQGNSGNAAKLMNWLAKWEKNNDGTKKHAKPNPWAKDNDGSAFKAALLSGPPGVGKTTTAHLVSKELVFDIVEFNASDTRSKKLLKEEVSGLLSNTSMHGYASGTAAKPSRRRVLIMDEVDGMAGNEDRGGVAELIALIKDSHVPIICMCNDRNHPKIRSLANYCFDLRFYKPSTQQIRGAMMSVCFKEGIKIDPASVDEIINGTGNDIRQTLNHLAMYSTTKGTKLAHDEAKKNAKSSEKDIKIGQFDVARKIFSADERKKLSYYDKFDLFFNDYNMTSLFVQENYLKSRPDCGKPELLQRIAKTADSLSLGDLVERKIRSNQAWSLLPTQSTFSCFLPGEYMSGSFNAMVGFPSWLGKFSKANKRKRLAQEIHDHTRISTSGSRMSVRLDYAQFLVAAIIRPLQERGVEGVPDALKIIKEYRLLREDIDSLLELSIWPKMKNPWESIDGKVKAALTRAYNKEIQPYSYSVQSGIKKKAAKISEEQEEGYEDDGGSGDEEDEDEPLEKNSLIKVKKPAQSKEGKAPKASTSKRPSKSN